MEHEAHLREVFQLLRENKLVVNQKWCNFGVKKVEYLGHIVSTKGVLADPSKVAAMFNWPAPKDVKGLRGFLGLMGYSQRFVKGYGLIGRPLTDLLKKDSFLLDNRGRYCVQPAKVNNDVITRSHCTGFFSPIYH